MLMDVNNKHFVQTIIIGADVQNFRLHNWLFLAEVQDFRLYNWLFLWWRFKTFACIIDYFCGGGSKLSPFWIDTKMF